MSNLLWGKVFFKEHFAGLLKEETGGGYSFQYDEDYLQSNSPAISYSLVKQKAAHFSSNQLHPFFDNLIAEGWLETAQTRLLGKKQASRFELLLAFGIDSIGAVSVQDPEPSQIKTLIQNIDSIPVMTSRASLSGIQPKITLIKKKGKFHPTKLGEISTHFAKFPSNKHADLIENEYLTTKVFQALLPKQAVTNLFMGEVQGYEKLALIIQRFDRTSQGEKIHFEEFNQLLQNPSTAKYKASYKDMANFISNTSGCLQTEIYNLFLRIIAGLLLGNLDMHLKNFAMFNQNNDFRLTPSYDQVAVSIYPDYRETALYIGSPPYLRLENLNAKKIIELGKEFQLSRDIIYLAYQQLAKNKEKALTILEELEFGNRVLKNKILQATKKRWNSIFKPLPNIL